MASAVLVRDAPASALCPRCSTTVSWSPAEAQRCGRCGIAFQAVVIEPPAVAAAVRRLAEAGPDAVTACAAHAMNQAVGACERCGAFFCDLCRIDADGWALCSACWNALSAAGALHATSVRLPNFARLSTLCLLASLFLWIYLGVLLGPAAGYLAWKGSTQRAERGMEPQPVRLGIKMLLGGIVTMSQVVVVGWFILAASKVLP